MLKHHNSKIICWVSFNLQKDLDNHYIKLILLFKPFVNLKSFIPNNKLSWKAAYIFEKSNWEHLKTKCLQFNNNECKQSNKSL